MINQLLQKLSACLMSVGVIGLTVVALTATTAAHADDPIMNPQPIAAACKGCPNGGRQPLHRLYVSVDPQRVRLPVIQSRSKSARSRRG